MSWHTYCLWPHIAWPDLTCLALVVLHRVAWVWLREQRSLSSSTPRTRMAVTATVTVTHRAQNLERRSLVTFTFSSEISVLTPPRKWSTNRCVRHASPCAAAALVASVRVVTRGVLSALHQRGGQEERHWRRACSKGGQGEE